VYTEGCSAFPFAATITMLWLTKTLYKVHKNARTKEPPRSHKKRHGTRKPRVYERVHNQEKIIYMSDQNTVTAKYKTQHNNQWFIEEGI